MYTNRCIIITSIYKVFTDMNMEGNFKSYKTIIMPIRFFSCLNVQQ